MTTKRFGAVFLKVAPAENDDSEDGEFEAVLSAPTLDRDGEVIDAKAFEPLPDSIPIHAFHNFDEPVARATPYYDGDVLKARGVFDPDDDAQRIRQKVGRSIGHMSVGFMSADRETRENTTYVTKAELLEASFVSVPSNREAEIITAKSIAAKMGARNSAGDQALLQAAHDAVTTLGAVCDVPEDDPDKGAVTISTTGAATASSAGHAHLIGEKGHEMFLSAVDGREIARLTRAELVRNTKNSTKTDPEAEAAAPAAADPRADVAVALALAQARAALLLLD